MKIKAATALLVSALIVSAGIIITAATGLWTTESTKIPKRLDIPSREIVSGTASGDGEGLPAYDPSDIRGSYTFSEISDLFDIPLEDLAEAFMVSESRASGFKCKDLGTHFEGADVEIGTASMRMFVSYYYGLDYAYTEEAFFPATALEILKSGTRITAEQLVYVEAHIVEVTAAP
ncbi:MAG: hypothetical protein ACYC5K_06655 [Saccharofermentanales bacterium]|jgi:hypothetical protein